MANNYHHHVATNIWLGTNILPANDKDSKPGLAHYAVRLSYNKKEIDDLKRRLVGLGILVNETTLISEMQQEQPSSFHVYNTDGIKIQFFFN